MVDSTFETNGMSDQPDTPDRKPNTPPITSIEHSLNRVPFHYGNAEYHDGKPYPQIMSPKNLTDPHGNSYITFRTYDNKKGLFPDNFFDGDGFIGVEEKTTPQDRSKGWHITYPAQCNDIQILRYKHSGGRREINATNKPYENGNNTTKLSQGDIVQIQRGSNKPLRYIVIFTRNDAGHEVPVLFETNCAIGDNSLTLQKIYNEAIKYNEDPIEKIEDALDKGNTIEVHKDTVQSV